MVHLRYFCGRSMVNALLAGITAFARFTLEGGGYLGAI